MPQRRNLSSRDPILENRLTDWSLFWQSSCIKCTRPIWDLGLAKMARIPGFQTLIRRNCALHIMHQLELNTDWFTFSQFQSQFLIISHSCFSITTGKGTYLSLLHCCAQAHREPQWGPGKQSHGAPLWRKFLNFSFYNGTLWYIWYFWAMRAPQTSQGSG